MAVEIGCPDVERLRQLMLGQIPAGDAESLGEHLLHCPRCSETVRSLDATAALVQAARAGARSATHADSDWIANLMARLKQLHPPDCSYEGVPTVVLSDD